MQNSELSINHLDFFVLDGGVRFVGSAPTKTARKELKVLEASLSKPLSNDGGGKVDMSMNLVWSFGGNI